MGDHYLLNRLRLNLDLRPAGWLLFRVQGQDSRVFGQNATPAPASQKDVMDVHQAYVQVGGEEGLVILRAGRQSLDFGEGRLLADPNWGNVGRSFDAVRLTLGHGQAKVDVFTGALVKASPTGFDRRASGQHFHGAYGVLAPAPGMSLEPYLFWRIEPGYKNENGTTGKLNQKTVGVRWAGLLPLGFDYGAELAGQTGSAAGNEIGAWTGHWVLGHSLPDTRHRPRLFLEYNRASGDANSRDGRQGTFDPLFPSTHDKYGLVDLFGSSNLIHVRPGFQYTIRSGLRIATAYGKLWLANARGGLYAGGKIAARDVHGAAGSDVGHEADVQVLWTASSATQVNAGYGHLFPGEFLQRTTTGVPYHILFLNVTRRF